MERGHQKRTLISVPDLKKSPPRKGKSGTKLAIVKGHKSVERSEKKLFELDTTGGEGKGPGSPEQIISKGGEKSRRKEKKGPNSEKRGEVRTERVKEERTK